MVMYYMTLAPWVGDQIDSPKFQFMALVLGVPHPPGYPLYVLLSHAFSYLPIGTLAYRINMLSAVFASLTVGLMFLCGRQVGCGRLMSIIGALGLACGQVFWSVAIVAEVYTLTTAMLAATFFALLRWG